MSDDATGSDEVTTEHENKEITAVDIDPKTIELPLEDIEREAKQAQSHIELVAEIMGEHFDNVDEQIEAINKHLDQIDETLEANERHIHVIPPDADVSSPIISLELTAATFALTLPFIQLIQGNQVNALSAALGCALLAHPILSYLRKK